MARDSDENDRFDSYSGFIQQERRIKDKRVRQWEKVKKSQSQVPGGKFHGDRKGMQRRTSEHEATGVKCFEAFVATPTKELSTTNFVRLCPG